MGSNDFRTDHLNKEQKRIAKTVIDVAKWAFEEPDGGGCTAFYTPEQWRERGEEYGRTSKLIVCHDGGDLSVFFDYSSEAYSLMDRMDKRLKDIGYFVEQCTGWYSAIYKL